MKSSIETSITHKDVVKEAAIRYPLTPKPDALVLLYMFYFEKLKNKKPIDTYYDSIRLKLLRLFVISADQIN